MGKYVRQMDPLWMLVRPMMRATIILLGLFIIGTVGYRHYGGPETTWLDAFYMTTITLTTVGYGEVVDLSHSPDGRIFTIALLLVGVGAFLYFFSNVTAFVVEGTLDRLFWRRRMTRRINSLEDHFIVCGGGTTGGHIIKELIDTGRPFVLIEASQERVDGLYAKFDLEFPVVIGDATDDVILRDAGIEKARGVVTCISNDKDNLVVTFSSRHLNKNVRIVTRCTETRDREKLKLAGADAVVHPDQVGGLRLASELLRPTVVSFLDTMLRDKHLGLRVEEVLVAQDSTLKDSTVGELKAREIHGLLIVALRSEASGVWTYNPDNNERLSEGTSIVFMGLPETQKEMRELV
jgi:voltage-gated potassium channel